MNLPSSFRPSPWDTEVFGVDAYEIVTPSREALDTAMRIPGHYTVRVDPLAPKELLHEYGFYYCDTLLEPWCTAEHFRGFDDAAVAVSWDIDPDFLLAICHGAFSHGRFHRDFHLQRDLADQRYDNWLMQLHGSGSVVGLRYEDALAGFIAIRGNKLVLHALTEPLRGRGLAKFLWTPVCRMLFAQGCKEVTSSVSAANLAVVNLYAALGFRFRNPVDLYHRLTQ